MKEVNYIAVLLSIFFLGVFVIGGYLSQPGQEGFVDIGWVHASEGSVITIQNGTAVSQEGDCYTAPSSVGTMSFLMLSLMTTLLLVTTWKREMINA